MTETPNWNVINPTDHDSFNRLGPREKGAVWAVLETISAQRTGQKTKPIKITITDQKPFDLTGFVQTLEDLKIYPFGHTDYPTVFHPIAYEEIPSSVLSRLSVSAQKSQKRS